MEDEEIDCEYTDEIVCPHCGHEFRDSFEYPEYVEEIECYQCEGKFSMNRNITITYCTEK